MAIVDRWRDYGVTGALSATILVSSTRYTVWPIYLKSREVLSSVARSPAETWIFSAIYFSFRVGLVLLLTREGKKYPGMILDVICAGSLVTVAVGFIVHEYSKACR